MYVICVLPLRGSILGRKSFMLSDAFAQDIVMNLDNLSPYGHSSLVLLSEGWWWVIPPFDLLFMTIGIDGDECCCLVDYINNADLAALPRAFERFLRSRLLNSRQNLLATISCESGYLSMINIFHYATSFTPSSSYVVYFLFSLLSKFFCTHSKLFYLTRLL